MFFSNVLKDTIYISNNCLYRPATIFHLIKDNYNDDIILKEWFQMEEITNTFHTKDIAEVV